MYLSSASATAGLGRPLRNGMCSKPYPYISAERLGGLDILRNMAQGSVPEENVATDEEVKQMLTDVFGSEEAPDEPDEETPVVDEEDVATDEEVIQMLNEVYGSN